MKPLTESQEKKLKTARLLAIMMLIVAPILYAIIAVSLELQRPPAEGANDMLFYILLIVAAAVPLIMPLVQRVQIAAFRRNTGSKMSPGQLFFTLSIQRFAFAESAFIFGLVVALVTGDLDRMVWFYLIGAACAAIVWPRRSFFEDLLERLEQS